MPGIVSLSLLFKRPAGKTSPAFEDEDLFLVAKTVLPSFPAFPFLASGCFESGFDLLLARLDFIIGMTGATGLLMVDAFIAAGATGAGTGGA